MAGLWNTAIQATSPVSAMVLEYLVDKNGVVGRNQLRNEYASEVYWYADSDSIEINSTRSLTTEHWKMNRIIGEHRFEQPFVCSVETGFLTGYTPTVTTGDYRPIKETQVGRKDLVHRDLIKHPRTLVGLTNEQIQPQKTLEHVCPLPFLYSNYYFWLRHTLPRLQGVEQYANKTGIRPKLLVQENPPRWINETLDFLGFDDYERIEWSGEDVLIKDMIIPSARGMEYDVAYHNHGEDTFIQYWCPPPSALSWLRKRALANITGADSAGASKKILISREDALSRRVTNQTELFSQLEQCGFERYVLSELSFEEQVSLFANANHIVTPHGAGLTNTIFSSDCTVLEIFHSEKIKPTYNLIAQCRGLDYNYSIERADGRDIIVDVDRIVDFVAQNLE